MGAGAPIALIGTLPMYQKNAAIDASHTMHGKIQLIFPLLNGVIVKLAKIFCTYYFLKQKLKLTTHQLKI